MITAYKGTDENMTCTAEGNSKTYEIGVQAEETGEIRICENGIHACENPLDVFKYYKPNGKNRFFVVKADGKIDREKNKDSKIACEKVTLKEEIKVASVIKTGIEMIFKKQRARLRATAPQARLRATTPQARLRATAPQQE